MKKTYIISYDMTEGGDYEELFKAIKSYGTWAHIAESVWAVSTDLTAEEIRDHLLGYLSDESRIFVVKSGLEAAWKNVICSSDWLKKNL